jgi:hypothetical protein
MGLGPAGLASALEDFFLRRRIAHRPTLTPVGAGYAAYRRFSEFARQEARPPRLQHASVRRYQAREPPGISQFVSTFEEDGKHGKQRRMQRLATR